MKTKILIILIVLIGLSVGGVFVYKNLILPEKPVLPEEKIKVEEKPEIMPEEKPEEEALPPQEVPTPTLTPTLTPTPTPTPPPTLIGDFVWDDKNADGIQVADEPGIPGVLVVLYDALGNFVNSTTTNGAGLYTFTVQPGTYSEVFVPPKGYVFSPQDQGNNDAIDSDADPSSGCTSWFTVAADQADLTWDAGTWKF